MKQHQKANLTTQTTINKTTYEKGNTNNIRNGKDTQNRNHQQNNRETKKPCSELKSYHGNKEDSIKLEIRNLQTQIEHLKKVNNVLKSKAKIAKLRESTKTQPNIKKLNESIQEHNEAIKSINLQLENQDRNYARNTIERIENNLKEHEEKIKKQRILDKAVDQKIKEILNTSESFQDNGNPLLTFNKKGKILHHEEIRANELQRKQPRSKKFELVIFGDSITKRIDPSFIARCEKSLALNYSIRGAKVRGVYEQMRTFRENHQEAAITNVIIHVGTNHLPRDQPSDITTKISKLLLHATKEFPNTLI